jgi:hypothetical protein
MPGSTSFLGSNVGMTDTDWAPQPGRNHTWAMADDLDADVSAVGWGDRVRFHQISRWKLVEGRLSSVAWTDSFMEN